MRDNISLALSRLFDRHRIVFWYDAKQELYSDFKALQLDDVCKLELVNNEFSVKHRVLRDEPQGRFLLYKAGPQPADLDNWLLDVQLAHGEFRTDQIALWLAELDLGLEFADVVEAHAEFFKSTKRKESLKKFLKPDDTAGLIRLKLMAVCTAAEPRLDAVVEMLLAELAENKDEKFKLLMRCGLDNFLWGQMQRNFGYRSDSPGVRDFVLELFKSCFAMGTDGEVKLGSDALVFLKRWKDSRQFEQSFEVLSAECADILGMEQNLSKRDFRELMDLDYFRLIDLKVISEMVQQVSARTVSAAEVSQWIRQRRQGHWYGQFAHLYGAIEVAADFLRTLDEAQLVMTSLAEGLQRYSQTWYRLDQLYRKFIYHIQSASQVSLMSALNEQIENLYSTNYVLKLNNRWQLLVDAATTWEAPPVMLQRTFFKEKVKPFLDRDNKVCVIISDALRYEAGDELLTLIRQEDRFDAELTPALSMLPSYTQLGMAALLPNKELALADDGTSIIDGQSTKGTPNRDKLLKAGLAAFGKQGTALRAKDLMEMDKETLRELFRSNDVLYIYHNLIDKTGDTRDTEGSVFAATEETLAYLLKLIKKLAGANANNLLVTADHGFLYQNRVLADSDFLGQDADGAEVLYRDRRFVLGRGLVPSTSLRSFTSAELGLTGDMEVQIPKSIHRLRLQGSGSRYVHGGATLQELVIPVIRINKKRQSDLSVVDVEILRGSTSTISSGQLAVVFYQKDAVTDKLQARHLRAGIFNQAGELISDSHELTFDRSSDNSRDREQPIRFVLTRKADDANGQEVILRLDERQAGTTHYKEYKSVRYLVRRSFISDFDF